MQAPAASKTGYAPFEVPNRFTKFGLPAEGVDKAGNFIDPVHQVQSGAFAPTVGLSFDGSSDDDNSAVLGFRVVPPDTDGDVGPNHYVQWINSVTEIFDKNGNTLLGPVAGNIYFQGLGGDCEADNNGDPIVLYDELADRWLVSQFAVSVAPYFMCIAISETSDPTGAYHQYAFPFGNDGPDYPKLGIWGDSYTMTTRDFFNFSSFVGISAVAMDRDAMLAGQPTTMVRFPNAFASISDGPLPADADNAVTGPALFAAHGNDSDTTFELWQLNVDWNNPGAATFSALTGVTIPTYDGIVPSANQPNGQVLDDLSNFTMHRANVRDFGTHKSMVANHSVEVSTGVIGVRWYEFRNMGANWTLYQSGTYSPNSDDRWMGSIAINANSDIALGYSRSSSSLFPSIYMTGQTADQSGTGVMNVAETLLHAGGGSQSGASRWGDYSMMSVDPTDDTSFWYTTEYYASTASFDFNTRIVKFDLGGGGGGNIPPVASFTSTCTNLVCNFTDTSTDADGTIASRAWTFGDGGTSTLQNPSHTYATAGTFTVGLTVTDNAGGTGTTSQSVTVTSPGGGTMHIASITITAVKAPGVSGRVSRATVKVVDNNGVNVGSATVSGEYYGLFAQTPAPVVTNSSGDAIFTSTTSSSGRNIINLSKFCVNTITHASLTYTPANNVDPIFDCTVAPDAPQTESASLAANNATSETPVDFDIAQNYPNPFNPTTIIAYAVPEATDVTVKVFNMLGQEVATLASGYHDAGRYEVAFNANDLSAGIYLYTIKAGSVAVTKRMTLLK